MRDWNPQAYVAFADERLRPAQDLLARVPPGDRRVIFDLGSGPGNSTALLRAAYPGADITGIEASPAMVARAREAVPTARFVQDDVRNLVAPADTDLAFSNALLQWLPDHNDILVRLLAALKPGAALAVQMPDNLDEPSHALMRKVAALAQFARPSTGADALRARIMPAGEYYNLLSTYCTRIDIWQTRYNHVATGHGGIADFFASTGLKPYLDGLSPDRQRDFRAAYEQELAVAYPALADGRVMFALPRIFIVAVR